MNICNPAPLNLRLRTKNSPSSRQRKDWLPVLSGWRWAWEALCCRARHRGNFRKTPRRSRRSRAPVSDARLEILRVTLRLRSPCACAGGWKRTDRPLFSKVLYTENFVQSDSHSITGTVPGMHAAQKCGVSSGVLRVSLFYVIDMVHRGRNPGAALCITFTTSSYARYADLHLT